MVHILQPLTDTAMCNMVTVAMVAHAAVEDGQEEKLSFPPGVSVAPPPISAVLGTPVGDDVVVPVCALFLHGANGEKPSDLAKAFDTAAAAPETAALAGVEGMEKGRRQAVDEGIAGTSGGGRRATGGKGKENSKRPTAGKASAGQKRKAPAGEKRGQNNQKK